LIKFFKSLAFIITTILLLSCEDSMQTQKKSGDTKFTEVDQEFVKYVKEEIANPQQYISYLMAKCMLKNASEVSVRFKTYVKDKKGFGKEGFESEDKVPSTILMDYKKFAKNYCM